MPVDLPVCPEVQEILMATGWVRDFMEHGGLQILTTIQLPDGVTVCLITNVSIRIGQGLIQSIPMVFQFVV